MFSPTGRSSTPSHPGMATPKSTTPRKRAEPVWNPDEHPGAWRAIWAYSAKRARRDQKTLHAQEARARAVVDGEQEGQIDPVRQDPGR